MCLLILRPQYHLNMFHTLPQKILEDKNLHRSNSMQIELGLPNQKALEIRRREADNQRKMNC